MPSKKKPIKPEAKPRVHAELEGLQININSFGELGLSMPIEQINAFLNRNMDDRKLRGRDFPDET